MKAGIELIQEERCRQRNEEGFTPSHDAQHNMGELTDAAICYATVASAQIRGSSKEEWPVEMFSDSMLTDWPWEEEWYKPSDYAVKNLIKAGALIAAELDRLMNVGIAGATREQSLCRCGHDKRNHPSGCIICICRGFVPASADGQKGDDVRRK